jgi:hypothetical protein
MNDAALSQQLNMAMYYLNNGTNITYLCKDQNRCLVLFNDITNIVRNFGWEVTLSAVGLELYYKDATLLVKPMTDIPNHADFVADDVLIVDAESLKGNLSVLEMEWVEFARKHNESAK